jgi:hypothetical protein
MSRPTLEVADILRVAGSSFVKRYGSHLAPQHRKVMDGIVRCRTAALGGHRDRCSGCGQLRRSSSSSINWRRWVTGNPPCDPNPKSSHRQRRHQCSIRRASGLVQTRLR